MVMWVGVEPQACVHACMPKRLKGEALLHRMHMRHTR